MWPWDLLSFAPFLHFVLWEWQSCVSYGRNRKWQSQPRFQDIENAKTKNNDDTNGTIRTNIISALEKKVSNDNFPPIHKSRMKQLLNPINYCNPFGRQGISETNWRWTPYKLATMASYLFQQPDTMTTQLLLYSPRFLFFPGFLL